MALNVLSLCDGIGGGRFALASAGIPVRKYWRVECEFAKDKESGEFRETNMQWPARIGDAALARFGDCVRLRGRRPHGTMAVQDFGEREAKKVGRVDLVIAGFPCQPFSSAGGRAGFADPRAGVLDEILRIMELVRPRAFLLENVKAAKEVRAKLAEKIGFFPTAWDSMRYGAQKRERDLYSPVRTRPRLGMSDMLVGDIMLPPGSSELDNVRHYHWNPLEKTRGRYVIQIGKKGAFAGLGADILEGRILEDTADYGTPARNPDKHGKRARPAEGYGVATPNGKSETLKGHGGSSGGNAGGIFALGRYWIRPAETVYAGKTPAQKGHRKIGEAEGGYYPVSQSQAVKSRNSKCGTITAGTGAEGRQRGPCALAGLVDCDIPQSLRAHARWGKSPTLTAETLARSRTDGLIVGDYPLICRPLCPPELLALQWLPADFDFGEAPPVAIRSGLGNGFDAWVIGQVIQQIMAGL